MLVGSDSTSSFAIAMPWMLFTCSMHGGAWCKRGELCVPRLDGPSAKFSLVGVFEEARGFFEKFLEEAVAVVQEAADDLRGSGFFACDLANPFAVEGQDLRLWITQQNGRMGGDDELRALVSAERAAVAVGGGVAFPTRCALTALSKSAPEAKLIGFMGVFLRAPIMMHTRG